MPIITIARGSMWGGQAVAERTAQALGAPCIGREALVREALKSDVSPESLAVGLGEGESRWDRVASDRTTYLATIRAALADRAAGGDFVYHGHAGHLLLRGIPGILRVRIIAPMEMRVRTVMEKEDLSRGDAEAYILRMDEEWVRWTRFLYGVDWRDPSLYDLVINMEGMSVDSACACIVRAASRPEFAITREIRELIDDFALACRVRLALTLNAVSRNLDLEVVARRGSVLVRRAAQKDMPAAIRRQLEGELSRIVGSQKGVRKVSIDLRYGSRTDRPRKPGRKGGAPPLSE